ncbi:hypothetical protein Tco_1119484 [Tanacetum coccineum]
MDKKINTIAEKQAGNKRKFENTSRNNQSQQRQENKRQNTGRAYTVKGLHDSSVEFGDTSKRKDKNNNRGNQVRNANAPAKVYAVGHAGINPNSNVVTVPKLTSHHLPWITIMMLN